MEFPKLIIQLLQSSCFLTTKEAARTTTLSKSWNTAWLTRPNLVLDESDFEASRQRDYHQVGEFPNYAKRTLKRYEQSNLKIESFKLCMTSISHTSSTLADKLIVKALRKLGPTRLSLHMNRSYVLPHEVLFGADNNLVELSVVGCHIKQLDHGILLETKRSRLEYLSLDEVYITRDALSKIISSCPFIEKLSLSRISFEEQQQPRQRHFEEQQQPRQRHVGPKRGPRTGPQKTNLDRLRCLVLCYGSFKALFPGDSLSKFPFLVDLTLVLNNVGHRAQQEDLQISNHSLERLKMEAAGGRVLMPRIKLDVPSVRKFTFVCGDSVPSLHFVSCPTREWESHVSIKVGVGLTAFWYKELNDLLTQLSQSKTHLSLLVACPGSFNYKVGEVDFVRKHELENLEIDMSGQPSFACYALFDGLFRLCRPKIITQTQKKKENPNPHEYQYKYHPPQYQYDPPQCQYAVPQNPPDQRKMNFVLLCQLLEQGIHWKVSFPRQLMYGLNDLEEANAQIFDDDDAGRWRPPFPLRSLLLMLEDEEEDLQQQGVRLLLKWKP